MKQFITLLIILLSCVANAMTSEEKGKIVEGIYNRVYASMGLMEEKPKFLFDTRQASKIAYMMKNKDGFPMIGFEEKAFDVCAQFGARRDDAIAYLIGHEISHHHFKHHWGNEFSSAFSVSSLGQEIRDLDRENIKRFEAQADERGGIFCYLAGYNTMGISEKLLTDLYTAYAIKDGPKYPTLKERIRIAKDQDSIVSTYIKVFETANYAMLVREFDVAIKCYEYIIGKGFHSREIYNNLGVVYFLQGLELADDGEVPYLYPVEIDLESKRNRGSSKGMGDGVKSIFEKALEKFQQAIGFDKVYTTGYINAASAMSVLGIYDEALIYAKRAERFAKEQNSKSAINNARLLQALLEYQSPDGDQEKGMKLLKELAEAGHDYSIYNKTIIEGGDISKLAIATRPLGMESEDIADLASSSKAPAERIEGIKDFSSLDVMQKEEIKYARNETIVCGTRNDSKILMIELKGGDVMVFHATNPSYKGQMNKGIKIGSSENELFHAYGLPGAILNSRQGFIYLYPKNKMLVFVDANKNVTQWVAYSIM